MDSSTIRVASVADTALDIQAMTETGESGRHIIMEYAESRDETLVRALPGEKITWFHVRRLRSSEFIQVKQASSDAEQYQRAFAIGVTKIENFAETGSRTVLPEYTPDGQGQRGQGRISFFTDEQMDRISPAFIEEIGSVVWQRSFLAHMPEVSYQPPPSFRRVLATRLHRVAADAAKAARPQSSEPPPAEEPTADSGESAIDATATA